MSGQTRLLIVGAGEAGRLVVGEIQRENRSDISILGFVDDDKWKQGASVHGIPVVGAIADLPRLAELYSPNQVLISTPSIGKDVVERVVRLTPQGVAVKVLPSIASVIMGRVSLSSIRDIDLGDLIGRPLVKSDQQRIARSARDKVFLVTGGAGSIGSEIVRQLYHSGAKKIIIFDAWEEGIYNILEELSDEDGTPYSVVKAYVGTIRERERIDEVFLAEGRVDVVLHAAAYKHVPLMEENQGEAIKTNVDGTREVLDAAIRHGVKDFVLISSDKAVRPVSVMGKTKRDAELLVKDYAMRHPDRRFCIVRFGNVLNSSGSVVPKFLRQIQFRKPVTITDFRMTRYFMSIPEAVSLVLLAWIIAENGQTLVLDMGRPVKVLDIALNLIRMQGLEPYTEIEIREVGMRSGEKLHEELSYDTGLMRCSPVSRVFIAEELP